jgi:transposase
MAETFTVNSERVDDIPLLLAQMKRMGVQLLVDKHFPTHGNREGLSLGGLIEVWLTHILSQADHRLNHVQPWAEKRLETLRGCIGPTVRALDFSDDRLEDALHILSDDARWEAFEGALNRRVLRVYELSTERVRLDSTSASGYWSVDGEGLFEFGHSKDRRPDLPQVKVMLSSLDPLGLPVAVDVLSGSRADDPLYIPAVRRVRQSLARRGLLYVGDCKMAALQSRAFIGAGEDFYLCPLSETQLQREVLEDYLAAVFSGQQHLMPVYRPGQDGEQELIAEGYQRLETLTAQVDGKAVTWTERRLVVRSIHQAQRAKEALLIRLKKAQKDLESLNQRGRGKRHFRQIEPLQKVAGAILERYQVQDLLNVNYREIVEEHPVRRYRQRPATVRLEREVIVSASIDEEAVEKAIQRMGWRVYATNSPPEQLGLTEAVLAYRNAYIIERGFGRLKGKPLSLTPMYLQRDDHATGLIRLLSIGLRVLTLLEFVIRRRLAQREENLAGLYAGNPKRVTAKPTAERLLEAFQEITLTIIREPNQIRRHLTTLSKLQLRILELLGFPLNIYTRLCFDSPKPPRK